MVSFAVYSRASFASEALVSPAELLCDAVMAVPSLPHALGAPNELLGCHTRK